jgi:hypothetical protein
MARTRKWRRTPLALVRAGFLDFEVHRGLARCAVAWLTSVAVNAPGYTSLTMPDAIDKESFGRTSITSFPEGGHDCAMRQKLGTRSWSEGVAVVGCWSTSLNVEMLRLGWGSLSVN